MSTPEARVAKKWDELAAKPFSERMLHDESFEFRDERRVPAKLEVGVRSPAT